MSRTNLKNNGVKIGERMWPIDWNQRTQGQVIYTGDMLPENVLQGAILRSPYPLAEILDIDTSRAETMPGVHAVITHKNFAPEARYGVEYSFDRPPLAIKMVRFVGQEIAAVAAETKEQAQAAVAAIRVKYRRLKAPLTIQDSLEPKASELHDPADAPKWDGDGDWGGEGGGGDWGGGDAAVSGGDWNAGGAEASGGDASQWAGKDAQASATDGGAAQEWGGEAKADGGSEWGSGEGGAHEWPAPPKNIRRLFRRVWGDVETGRREGTVSVSGRYYFPGQAHTCMETHRTLAEWREDGHVHIWASTASPMPLRDQLVMVLGLPPFMIHVHEVAVGGSFGAKLFITDHEALAAVLSREAKRPVVIMLSREEEFETTRTRHPFDMDLKLSADKNGKLRMVEGTVLVDNGAYLHAGSSVMGASMIPLGGMYAADGMDIDAKLVDTCKLPGGAMRGYGGPQTTFPRECLMDELAEKLKIDPLQFRIDNVYGSDVETLGGHIGTNGTRDCLELVGKEIRWAEEKAHPLHGKGRGVGVATGEHVSGAHTYPGTNRADGVIDLYEDGRIRVRFGGSDAGTGQKTILAQIAAQELGVPWDKIGMLTMDTDEAPYEWGAWSSRGTHFTGQAIKLTSQKFAERLKKLAAQRLGEGEIRLEDGFARSERGEEIALGELVRMSNESKEGVLTHEESFVDNTVVMLNPFGDGRDKMSSTHNFTAHAAVVDVDKRTGKIKVLDYAAANDSGLAMNEMLLEGQIAGGVVMGLGGALAEEIILEQGKVVNPAFLHYATPRAADVPMIRPLLAGIPDKDGPYGAKGVGELPVNPCGPLISNAVYDAVGVRVRSLPITPDKIINGLAEKEGRKRKFNIWRRPSLWWIELVRRCYPLGLFRILHNIQTADWQAAPPPKPVQGIDAPDAVDGIVKALGKGKAVLGGGTDLQLRRRQNIFVPDRLVSVGKVEALKELNVGESGPIVLGAGVTLAKVADAVRDRVPAIAQAIDSIASPQIRNVATVAGNLVQAKRCWFFRNGFKCHKRMNEATLAPCYAIQGDHRFYHAAIDGHRCQATTPSDLATVLTSLDAVITIAGPKGTRDLPIEKFYTGPGETVLGEQDVVTKVTIPAVSADRKGAFRKLNLWQGDFAVASAALSVELDAQGRCKDVRLSLGAVGPVPLRMRKTERKLIGQTLNADTLRELLDKELDARAHPLARNEWKLDAVAGLAQHVTDAVLNVPAIA